MRIYEMNKSIKRSFKIIELIAKAGKPLPLSEIIEFIDIPKTTLFEVLH